MTHSHSHAGEAVGARLGLAFLLTAAFVASEAAAGWWANSLALFSDAGHNFADALALALSWYAVRMGRRVRIRRSDFDRLLQDGLRVAGSAGGDGPSPEDFWGGEPVAAADPAPTTTNDVT